MQRRAILAAAAALAFGEGACAPHGGEIELIDDAGQRVLWSSLTGRPRAVFFGFTHCPVICPVTVWELNDALEKIGAPDIPIHFITVDPERDTSERLRDYLGSYGGRVRGFTGEAAAIEQVAQIFEVTYRKQPLEGGEYSMDHTPTVFLVDAGGRIVDYVAYGSPPELMQERLRALAQSTAAT